MAAGGMEALEVRRRHRRCRDRLFQRLATRPMFIKLELLDDIISAAPASMSGLYIVIEQRGG